MWNQVEKLIHIVEKVTLPWLSNLEYFVSSMRLVVHTNLFLATADKPEDQCEMEGCNRPKLQEGTRLYDYCSKSHADQDAPNRAGKMWMCLWNL